MAAEFDPTSEKHHFGFVVRAVDPGCTMEMQIEMFDGTVVRLTSTDEPNVDRSVMYAAVNKAFEAFFDRFMR